MMTPDEQAEATLLHLATKDTHKLAIELGYRSTEEEQDALERLMLRDWIRLIDVTPVANAPGIFRVFRVMPEALDWLKRTQS